MQRADDDQDHDRNDNFNNSNVKANNNFDHNNNKFDNNKTNNDNRCDNHTNNNQTNFHDYSFTNNNNDNNNNNQTNNGNFTLVAFNNDRHNNLDDSVGVADDDLCAGVCFADQLRQLQVCVVSTICRRRGRRRRDDARATQTQRSLAGQARGSSVWFARAPLLSSSFLPLIVVFCCARACCPKTTTKVSLLLLGHLLRFDWPVDLQSDDVCVARLVLRS